jgi:hypothetical protein
MSSTDEQRGWINPAIIDGAEWPGPGEPRPGQGSAAGFGA